MPGLLELGGKIVTVEPHHPDCRYPHAAGGWGGLDPERCCYCAALIRQAAGSADDPLDYRYGGPGCGCTPPDGGAV